MPSSDYIDRFLHYFENIQHHVCVQTAYSSPSVCVFLLVLICAFSSFPVMLLNNGETACSSHAVTQPVKSRAERPAVNTYVLVCVCVCVGVGVLVYLSARCPPLTQAAHPWLYSTINTIYALRPCNQL